MSCMAACYFISEIIEPLAWCFRIQELEEGAFTDEYDLPIQGHGRLTSEAAQVNARASALEGRLKAQVRACSGTGTRIG